MRVARMPASDIGVQALNLVGEPHLLQEIQRAIDRRRLGRAFTIEIGEQVIGLGRFFAFQQQMQDLASDRRQLLPFFLYERLGFSQKGLSFLRTAGRVDVRVSVRVRHVGHFG